MAFTLRTSVAVDTLLYCARLTADTELISSLLSLLGYPSRRYDLATWHLSYVINQLLGLQDSIKNVEKSLDRASGELLSSDVPKIDQLMSEMQAFFSRLKFSLGVDDLKGSRSVTKNPNCEVSLSSAEVQSYMADMEGLIKELKALELKLRHIVPVLLLPTAGADLYKAKLVSVPDRPLSGSHVSPWIDTNLLRRWLNFCDVHHRRHCLLSEYSENIFVHRPQWLIDVEHMCIVKASPNYNYVALSYVWGQGKPFRTVKENLCLLQREGSIGQYQGWEMLDSQEDGWDMFEDVEMTSPSVSLPRTVSDVIHLVGAIGERYLWVDALCIVQDDEEHKQEHIRSMGSIYANAYLTIVAAGGTAYDGLRGIQDVTPPFQRRSNTATSAHNPSHLHKRINEHHGFLQSATWNKRAWTFQEQIFSRRLLVLGNSEVSWECHCAVWFEGLEPTDRICQNDDRVIAQGFSFSHTPSLRDFYDHVKQYARREATYPEDVLDAFEGILTVLRTQFTGGFITGLPVMFFDAALLWHSDAPLTRRRAKRVGPAIVMPPSWSWAAWCFERDTGTIDVLEQNVRPLVTWVYFETPTAKPRRVPFATTTHPETGTKDPVVPNNVVQILSANSAKHTLYCRPLQSFFKVKSANPPDASIVYLTSATGDKIGTLHVHQQPSPRSVREGTQCEVIAISAVTKNDEEMYNVLWIQWEANIAYRQGVGQIKKSAWDKQGDAIQRIDLLLG